MEGVTMELGVMLVGFVAVLGLMLYGMSDLDKQERKDTQMVMVHIATWLLQQERRAATGEYPRSVEVIDAETEKWIKKAQQVQAGILDRPLGND